jgi:hypothetical protein
MNNKPLGLIEMFANINDYRPRKNRWLAMIMERDRKELKARQAAGTNLPTEDLFKWLGRKDDKHEENCNCGDCIDRHEEAEEYDEATGFID